MGDVVPCEISIYDDRSFTFVLKTPPAAFLLKKAAKLQKASSKGANEIVATISKEDLRKIAETKLPDLNDAELAEQAAEAKAEEAERAKRDEMLAEMEAEAQNEHDASNVEVINEKNNEEENNQE